VTIAPTAADQGTFAIEVTVNVHDSSPDMTYGLPNRGPQSGQGMHAGVRLAGQWPARHLEGRAGAAHFEVHRGAPFVSGTQFDAEFRVLGNDGSELLSDLPGLFAYWRLPRSPRAGLGRPDERS